MALRSSSNALRHSLPGSCSMATSACGLTAAANCSHSWVLAVSMTFKDAARLGEPASHEVAELLLGAQVREERLAHDVAQHDGDGRVLPVEEAELHGAHGYLINQFLGKDTNRRRDQSFLFDWGKASAGE